MRSSLPEALERVLKLTNKFLNPVEQDFTFHLTPKLRVIALNFYRKAE